MKIQISIYQDRYGLLVAKCGSEDLFVFSQRKTEDRWLFWTRGHNLPHIFPGGRKKNFPYTFFVDSCRSKYFIKNGGEMPEGIEIIRGGGYIGVKNTGAAL